MSGSHFLELTELARLIQGKKVSPVELTKTMLSRIAKLDKKLHSFATVTEELALEQAKQAEAELMKGRIRARCTASRLL